MLSNLGSNKILTLRDVSLTATDIRQRIRDELEDTSLFGLSPGAAGYYREPQEIFGDKVCEKFWSEDLEEASKCLAFGRATASVFHLMRAMEVAVQNLGSNAGVPDVNKEWGKILSDLQSKISAMEKGPVRNQWSECHVNLYHVKQAWRNETMHPKSTYTTDQAKEVLQTVKVFLNQLEKLI